MEYDVLLSGLIREYIKVAGLEGRSRCKWGVRRLGLTKAGREEEQLGTHNRTARCETNAHSHTP